MKPNNLYTRFSIEIERSDKRIFEFLVPNRLVNKFGRITKCGKLLGEIFEQFRMGELEFDDYEPPPIHRNYWTGKEIDPPIRVSSICENRGKCENTYTLPYLDLEIERFKTRGNTEKTGVNRIAYKLHDLMKHIDGMKDTSNKLFDELKKILNTDDYENLPEVEKKIYQTLKDITQLNSHFPKRPTGYLR